MSDIGNARGLMLILLLASVGVLAVWTLRSHSDHVDERVSGGVVDKLPSPSSVTSPASESGIREAVPMDGMNPGTGAGEESKSLSTMRLLVHLDFPQGYTESGLAHIEVSFGASGAGEMNTRPSLELATEVGSLATSRKHPIELAMPIGEASFRVFGTNIVEYRAELIVESHSVSVLDPSALRSEYLKEIGALPFAGFGATGAHPTSVPSAGFTIAPGRIWSIVLIPLCEVRAQFVDSSGVELALDDFRCNPAWSVPPSGSNEGVSMVGRYYPGTYVGPQSGAVWAVPFGATFFLSPATESGGQFEFVPVAAKIAVDGPRVPVVFAARNTRVVRFRVISFDGTPIPNARILCSPMPSRGHVKGTGQDLNEWVVPVTSDTKYVIVYAPDYDLKRLTVAELGTGPNADVIDVVLARGLPRLQLDVAFPDGVSAHHSEVEVAVRIGHAAARAEDPAAALPSWSYLATLPSDNRLTVFANHEARRVSAIPTSRWYRFVESNRATKGELTIVQYHAHRLAGVVLTIEEMNEKPWIAGEPVSVRCLRGTETIGSLDSKSRADPVACDILVGQEQVIPLERGRWRIIAFSVGPAGVYCAATEVEVTDKFQKVTLTSCSPLSWEAYEIHDESGCCMDVGTTFFCGFLPLATMMKYAERIASAQASARRRTESDPSYVAEPSGLPRGMNDLITFASQKRGQITLPSSCPTQLVVIPSSRVGVFVGTVDVVNRVVKIGLPVGAVAVTFTLGTAPNGVEPLVRADHSDGWVVAIRDYSDQDDSRRVSGADLKIPFIGESACMLSLPEGRYVARLMRMSNRRSSTSPSSNGTAPSLGLELEWCDAVEFAVAPTMSRTIELPVIRTVQRK